MLHYLKKFEHFIILSLMGMLAVVVLLSTLELAWMLIQDLITPPLHLLYINELLSLFGFFLLILIGVELMESTKAYLQENVVHTEIVLAVALIALARKVIILEAKTLPGLTLVGLAALILALSIAYFLVKRHHY